MFIHVCSNLARMATPGWSLNVQESNSNPFPYQKLT